MKLKNSGLQEQTVKIIGFYLRHLSVNADFSDSECEVLNKKAIGSIIGITPE